MLEPRLLHSASRLLVLTLAYFITGWLGLKLPYIGSHITLIWLPTGIAVAALFRWGWPMWPGIFIGAFFVNLAIGSPWLLAAGIAVGNTLGPLLAVACLRRSGFRAEFSRLQDVTPFIRAAALGMLVSATGGVVNLAMAGVISLQAVPAAWLIWWMGDGVGVLLAAPLLLTLSRANLTHFGRVRRELLAWWLVAAPVAWLAFLQDYPQFGRTLPLAFLTLPLLAWSALRFGQTGAALSCLGFALAAAAGTAAGHGTFYLPDQHLSLFLLWSYMATCVLTGMLITALQAERHRVENTLREREGHFRTLFEGSSVGQMLVDPVSLRILECNRAAAEVIGYQREALCGVHVLDFQAVLGPAEVAAMTQRLFAGETLGFETQVWRKDRVLREVAVTVVMLRSDSGNRIHVTHQDITAAKQSLGKLRESEEKLRGLFELSPLGIALATMDGHFLEFNAAFQQMTGYTAEELRNLDYWTLTPESYAAEEARQLESLARHGRYGP